jgi:pseudouridine synthase
MYFIVAALLTYLINKPANSVCSHDSQSSTIPSVYSFLPQHTFKLHTVGRLDKATTGALLITDDTKLVEFGTNGGNVEKLYEAVCMGILDDAQLEKLRNGVDLQGGLGFSNPCPVNVISIERKTTRLQITLTQGKNRQVRRMLHSIGSGVISLTRVSFGALKCDSLREGEYRIVPASELSATLNYHTSSDTNQ